MVNLHTRYSRILEEGSVDAMEKFETLLDRLFHLLKGDSITHEELQEIAVALRDGTEVVGDQFSNIESELNAAMDEADRYSRELDKVARQLFDLEEEIGADSLEELMAELKRNEEMIATLLESSKAARQEVRERGQEIKELNRKNEKLVDRLAKKDDEHRQKTSDMAAEICALKARLNRLENYQAAETW